MSTLRSLTVPLCVVMASLAASGCELKSRLEYGGYGESTNAPGDPQAAAPAAPAPAPTEPTPQDVAWAAELPDSATVKAIVRGTSDQETLDLQNAALGVMQLYASARSGQSIEIVGASEGVPPLAAQRYEEYRAAQTQPKTVFEKRLSPTAEAYLRSTTFQVQVLQRVVPAASVAAYQQTPVYQDFAKDEAEREGQEAFARGIAILAQSQWAPSAASQGGGSGPSPGGGSAAAGGEDYRANCRARCDRYCPGAWGIGDQWTQSQAAHDSCLNEVNSCKISCN